VILLCTALAAGAAFGYSESQTKEYTASASVLFQNPQLDQQASGLQVLQTSPNEDPSIMATNVKLLTEQSGVAQATARIIAAGLTTTDIAHAITVSAQGQTSIALVSATTPHRQLAAEIANTFVAQFIAHQRLQQVASVQGALSLVSKQISAMSSQQLAGVDGQSLLDRAESLRLLARLQDGGAQVVTSAKAPDSPSSPKVARNLLLGGALGLLIGLGLAFLFERLDRRMKTVADLEATYRLPLLAIVPERKSFSRRLLGETRVPRAEYEVFRLLRTYLRYFSVDRVVRSLLVTSPSPGDGKTTIARNLAEAAQETGTKTLLIEADLRRPDIGVYYGLLQTVGLSDVLIGSVSARDAVASVPIATRTDGHASDVSLDILLAGRTPPNPAELIESNAMEDLLSWATKEYELVVIDTAPIAVVSDAMPLLCMVDGVVLVSKLGKSTRDAAIFLRERLIGIQAPLLGIVVNGVKTGNEQGYGYGDGYGHRDENGHVAFDVLPAAADDDSVSAPGQIRRS
jgi:receptor protein-tyrosine kinase